MYIDYSIQGSHIRDKTTVIKLKNACLSTKKIMSNYSDSIFM
jgi:hypothetical protein